MANRGIFRQTADKILRPIVLIPAIMIALLVGAILAFCLLPSSQSSKITQARAYIYKAVDNPGQSNLEPMGVIDFTDVGNGEVVLNGSLQGLSPGLHGFHVHQFGELSKLCASAGPHLNPHGKTHGAPQDQERHVGDLGNIQVQNGAANVQIRDLLIALEGVNSIVGRGIVVHEKADDLGRGDNEESKKTGNAGKRTGCGVIGVKAEVPSR